MDYIEFASKLSFYEFTQDEFNNYYFNTEKYSDEFILLKDKLNIDKLVKILETNPRIIDIFEELFQLIRFTNTQLINFCFEISLINDSDEKMILNHMNKSILKFENGKDNEYFLEIYKKRDQNCQKINGQVFNLKKSIIEYIEKIKKNKRILYNHISNSISSRLRIAKYMIENLNLDQYIEKIDIKSLLELKRNPKDTKSIHGLFGSNKIKKILHDLDFQCLNHEIKERTIDLSFLLNKEFSNKFNYLAEKSINGILKRVDKKPKKFDFILFINNKPEYVIETNFYSTEGTKIGINEGEYISLKEDIEIFNKENNSNLKFIWITDGNYWLTVQGEKRFNNLKQNFFSKDYELLNYRLFKDFLNKIKYS